MSSPVANDTKGITARAVVPAGPTRNKPAEPATLVAEPSYYGCYYEYLCIYDSANMPPSSYMLGFYFCGFKDLGGYTFPPGGRWNDKTSSYVNNQTSGTDSSFHNWNGSSAWVHLFDSEALDWLGNLGSHNNVIDGIHVC